MVYEPERFAERSDRLLCLCDRHTQRRAAPLANHLVDEALAVVTICQNDDTLAECWYSYEPAAPAGISP